MIIGIVDIILIVLPILAINLLIVALTTTEYPFRSRFPILLVFYTIILTIIAFIVILVFHFLAHNMQIQLQELTTAPLIQLYLLDFDNVDVAIILWGNIVLISGFILSQLAFQILAKSYHKRSISGEYETSLNIIISEDVNKFISKYHIQIIIISDNTPALFAFSYVSFHGMSNYIIISDSTLTILDDNEINAGILHEIAHIKNFDTFFLPFFNALTKIMFFVFFLKYLKQKCLEKIELDADTFVLENQINPRILAHAILKISYQNVLIKKQSKYFAIPNNIYNSSSKKFLKKRIKNILTWKTKQSSIIIKNDVLY